MSHGLDTRIRNSSGKTITSFSLGHDWNGNIASFSGDNLVDKEDRALGRIETGFNEHDYYDISVTTTDGEIHSTKFYCDSSHSHDAVRIDVKLSKDGICDCLYYDDNFGSVDTGCYNKG